MQSPGRKQREIESDASMSEAKSLFDLLDLSGDGNVSADEFLNGCMRFLRQGAVAQSPKYVLSVSV